MTKFDISSNDLRAEGTKLLAAALKGNQIVTELNISSNNMTYGSAWGDMSGIIALVNVISDMGALLMLNLASNNLGEFVPPKGWSYGYHADYSGDEFYKHTDGREIKGGAPEGTTSGAIIIADAIKDMGALSCTNLLKNGIDADQANALVSILKEHPTLKSLCGNKGDETELDMSGKMDGAGDAIMLVPELIDNGAMTSLNLADNWLQTEGAKHIAVALKVSKCVLAIILAPLSCRSDQYFNCWCLLLSPGYNGADEPGSIVELAPC
jgi:hypothetical protein